LYGLPADTIHECIIGAIEARFGPINEKRTSAPSLVPKPGNSEVDSGLGPTCDPKDTNLNDCCADGISEAAVPLVKKAGAYVKGRSSEPSNFEEFIFKVWGAGIARHFMLPYNRKLWAVPLSEMETSWLGGRVPQPDLEDMIAGALSPKPKPMGPNARFGYPLRGGFQALMDGFLPQLKGDLRLNARVTGISPRKHTVVVNNRVELPYEVLVSTMPMPLLVRLMGDEAPRDVRDAASGLRRDR